jgi:exodeoxyribonuclease VII small subunit
MQGMVGNNELAGSPPLGEEPKESAEFSALSFEDALRELETIVRKLESGDVPLDDSIALYARGERLRAQCTKRLEDAEARIRKLTLDPGGAVTGAQPFGAD